MCILTPIFAVLNRLLNVVSTGLDFLDPAFVDGQLGL